ncbi:CHAD domain-containing protein [Streptomyces genisteinicus]|uniref:CHAD domain-containing protein n=1 Tax=Streptomyces genisteinicus TaxID=2768068 RepID=A0A7H0HTZ7_9ACTN|nr:CHAD domain-containing protein [Streptomyces genisteinicus]QNP64013.1 CHAD domain-containing protein [Streptomyces genisteinicus]
MSRTDTATAGEALARYLHTQAGGFLRSLRLHGESGADTAGAAEAARSLRSSARRISGSLSTFRPLLDPDWADALRAELGWLSATLALEHACTSRMVRLLDALSRLSGTSPVPRARTEPVPLSAHGTSAHGPGAHGPAEGGPTPRRGGALTVGAARAGALLERRLTLARTRAHSAALGALGSARFHAVADSVALLASDLPLAPAAAGPADEVLGLLAEAGERRLLDAVAELPLGRAAHPYNAEALVNGLASDPAAEQQDAPWHEVRRLLRLHRYAREVLRPGDDPVLCHAGLVLDHHREAADASEAAADAARTPRIAPATAYALGVLHADQRHEVEAARFAFQQEWRHATAAVPAP